MRNVIRGAREKAEGREPTDFATGRVPDVECDVCFVLRSCRIRCCNPKLEPVSRIGRDNLIDTRREVVSLTRRRTGRRDASSQKRVNHCSLSWLCGDTTLQISRGLDLTQSREIGSEEWYGGAESNKLGMPIARTTNRTAEYLARGRGALRYRVW